MKNKRAIIIAVIAAAIVGYAAYFFHVGDYIEAAIYKPTEEMSAVMTSIKLTSKGNRVFRSANPSLESNEDFNENCKTVSKDAYVLGCYITVSDQIHLYNVQFTEETKNLRGIIESTAAHEMLHAAWSRMNSWDRTSISDKLQAVYDSADKDFQKEFDTYSKNEFYDELHARVGVELKNIPEELEKHYAEYFEDRQAIVNYYENYRSVFKELRKKADDLATKIQSESKAIDKTTEEYKTVSNELQKKIIEFNKCSNETGCFSSVSDFNSQRGNLVAEIDKVNKMYDDLTKRTNALNDMIDEYNALVIKSDAYQNAINSKSIEKKVEEPIK